MKFGTLIKTYYQHPDFIRLDPKSQRMYVTYLDRLVELGGDLPIRDTDMPAYVAQVRSRSRDTSLANLTTAWWTLIDQYKTPGKTTTNSTRNTLHTYLKVAYRFAITKGHCSEAENPTRFEGWVHKRPTFTPFMIEDINAITESFKDPSYPEDVKAYMMFVVTMFHLGMRPFEMYKHEREWFTVKGDKTYLEVWGAKGKDKRVNDGKGEFSRFIALSPLELELMAYWDAQPKWMNCDHLTFRTSVGKAFAQTGWMAEKIRVGCSLAGIVPRTLYEARRGLVTTLAINNVPFETIKNRLGHIHKKTTLQYAQLTDEQKADSYVSPFQVARA